MALDYEQSAALRINTTFQGRIASAAIRYADSIVSNNAADLTKAGEVEKIFYAHEVFKSPNQKAAEIQPIVVQDPAVQAEGIDQPTGDSTISDAALQSAVEAAVAKVI